VTRWLAPAVLFVALAVASSIPWVRTWLMAPLVVSDPSAAGDAAYVLAGGRALHERLEAASDLYFLKRVPLLVLVKDDGPSQFSVPSRASWTRTQWAVDFLTWRGVPEEKILRLALQGRTRFGTLDEARSVAAALPPNVARLVVVTSAPHTRRSLLAFRRALPPRVTAVPYAATSIAETSEFSASIALEYVKLLAYAIVA